MPLLGRPFESEPKGAIVGSGGDSRDDDSGSSDGKDRGLTVLSFANLDQDGKGARNLEGDKSWGQDKVLKTLIFSSLE